MDSAIVWLDESHADGPARGFVVGATAFGDYCVHTGLAPLIDSVLAELPDAPSDDQLDAAAGDIASAFEGTMLPERLAEQLAAAYRELCARCADEALPVDVRGSLTGADLADAFEPRLRRSGEEDVLDAVKQCWSNLFDPVVLDYLAQQDLTYRDAPIVVAVTETAR